MERYDNEDDQDDTSSSDNTEGVAQDDTSSSDNTEGVAQEPLIPNRAALRSYRFRAQGGHNMGINRIVHQAAQKAKRRAGNKAARRARITNRG